MSNIPMLQGKIVIVTEPIVRGAFAGSTMTFRLGFDNVAGAESGCNGGEMSFSRVLFGTDGTSTIEVP